MNQIFAELARGRYNGKKFEDCDEAEQKIIIGYFLILVGNLLEIITKSVDATIKNTTLVLEHDFDAQKKDSADG